MNIEINDEIMQGEPSRLLGELQRQMAQQILSMECATVENVCDNMRIFADLFELLEEHINDEYIVLKHNPMSSWYIDNDNEIESF